MVPYFYDQFFWGKRLMDLGVGARPISQKQLSSDSLAAAVREVVGTPDIVQQGTADRRTASPGRTG